MSPDPPAIGDRVRDAESVVAEALAAFHAQQWEQLAPLTDADSLEKLRTGYLRRKSRRPPVLPPPSWEAEDPLQAEMRELAQAMADLPVTFHELAGVTTLEEAQALTSAEFIRRWAQARHEGYLTAHQLREVTQTLSERVVVGSVAILPDTVVVVVRTLHATSSQPLALLGYIVVLGNGRGEWKLDAASGWLGLTDAILG